MSNIALLEYSSWAFQLVAVLAILYLTVGLINPSLVKAGNRTVVASVAVAVLLVASTAFYIAILPLNSAPDGKAVSAAQEMNVPGAEPAGTSSK